MTDPNRPHSDATPQHPDLLEFILGSDVADPTRQDVEEFVYQHDLQLIDALTGHPSHIDVLDQPSKIDRERLSAFQSVIDELHPLSDPLKPTALPSTLSRVPDAAPSRYNRTRIRTLVGLAAGLIAAFGIGIWILKGPRDAASVATDSNTTRGSLDPLTVPQTNPNDPTRPATQTNPVPVDLAGLKQLIWSERTSTESLLDGLAPAGAHPEGANDLLKQPLLAMREASQMNQSQWQVAEENAVEDAEQVLQELSKKENKTVAELITLGNWNIYRKRPKSATKNFRAALALAPDLPEAWIGLALAFIDSARDWETTQLKAELSEWYKSQREGNMTQAQQHLKSIRRQLEQLEAPGTGVP